MTKATREKYEDLNNKADELKDQVRVTKNSENRFKNLMIECLLLKFEKLHLEFASLMVQNDEPDDEEVAMWKVSRGKLDDVEAMFA